MVLRLRKGSVGVRLIEKVLSLGGGPNQCVVILDRGRLRFSHVETIFRFIYRFLSRRSDLRAPWRGCLTRVEV